MVDGSLLLPLVALRFGHLACSRCFYNPMPHEYAYNSIQLRNNAKRCSSAPPPKLGGTYLVTLAVAALMVPSGRKVAGDAPVHRTNLLACSGLPATRPLEDRAAPPEEENASAQLKTASLRDIAYLLQRNGYPALGFMSF